MSKSLLKASAGPKGKATTANRVRETDSRRPMESLLSTAVDTLGRNMTCGVPEVEVEAARIIIESAAKVAVQSAYSMRGEISNNTRYTLELKSKTTNGNWTLEPNGSLPPGGEAKWSADYDGFEMNTLVVYTCDRGDVRAGLSIPLVGDNRMEGSTTISGCSVLVESGRGWHASVYYTLDQI